MATEQGDSWRIQIGDGAGTEAFTTIGGEVSFDWDQSATEKDDSSKDDGAYSSSFYTGLSITISANGKLKLPDPGMTRLVAASQLVPPVADVKIMHGSIVKYAGVMSIGTVGMSAPNKDVCTWKTTMKNRGAPTTNSLTASS